MQAQSHLIESHRIPRRHSENEQTDGLSHLASPCAAVCVTVAGAAVVVGAMLLVGVPELSVARFIPDFATLQSLVIG